MKSRKEMIGEKGASAVNAHQPGSEGGRLKLMTWNLRHGEGMDGRIDLERVARVILEEAPDLVALQELDVGCVRSGGIDQPGELARLTGMSATFRKAMDFDGGEYGQAVLSRLPVLEVLRHPLPGSGEPRIAVEIRLEDRRGELSMVGVHLDFESGTARLAQARVLMDRLADRARVILGGDFNDVPGSEVLALIGQSWQVLEKQGPGATIPAIRPEREIDHLFARGFEFVGAGRVVDEKNASDHRPVVGTVG